MLIEIIAYCVSLVIGKNKQTTEVSFTENEIATIIIHLKI